MGGCGRNWSVSAEIPKGGAAMVANSQPYRLLIADDDPNFRDVLKVLFGPYFELLEAASGEEAVEIVEQRTDDIALLDMHMHELTGLETLRIVKTFHTVAPCILITADATDDLRRTATEAEAFSVLKKPVSRRELVATVSSALTDAYEDPNPLSGLGF
jgi:CheY-like chemotaxis protein